jgi:ATP-dependent DNA helicase RecG
MSADGSESKKTPAGGSRDVGIRLTAPIEKLQGVGPKRAAQLKSFGIETIRDLLYHLPFRYEDRRQIKKIADAAPGEAASFTGRLIALQKKFVPRLRRQMQLATLRDDSASIDLIWYRAPGYLADSLANGRALLVHGKVEPGMPGRLRIAHPDFDFIDADEDRERQRILPIYVCPAGIPLSLMRRWAAQALTEGRVSLSSGLPEAIRQRQGLLDTGEALTRLHRPDAAADVAALNACSSPAHRTIIFDELFYLQLGLGRRKISRRGHDGIRFTLRSAGLAQRMKKLLPFTLTGAQRRVLGEIENDLGGDRPMQRLVQGDVGSGKTMVAWLASLRAIDNGHQALWMAPTEVLAEQHYRNLKSFADELRIPSALLTAATPAKEKRDLLHAIERADVAFVVGTHALIQEEVRAPRMGLGVIDEQHRFGVMQRLSLRRLIDTSAPSKREPHMLLMSATPIPRSLALVLYGDMEVSFVDEMPPGRTPVRTRVFAERERRQVYSIVLDELKRGHQTFVVLPLVEASEQLQQVRDATQMAEKCARPCSKTSASAWCTGA